MTRVAGPSGDAWVAARGGAGAAVRCLRRVGTARRTAAAAHAGSWLLRWLDDATFLCGLAFLVGALATFPDGRPYRRAAAIVVRVVAIAAGISSVALLVGSPTQSVAGQSEVDSGAYVPGLSVLGDVGAVLAATEPAWALAGILLLFLRYRQASPGLRRELRWPLWSVGVFAASLLLALVFAGLTVVLDTDVSFPSPLFLVALALFPVSLVAGIAARARLIEREVTDSRRRLLLAEDAGRRQLERDLHDGAQQQLVGVLSLLQLAQRQQGRDDPETEVTLSRATNETRRAIDDLRALVAGIHPSVLTDRGLVAALDSRLSVLPFPATLVADADAAAHRWPPAVEAAGYFVACEALTNAAKHSGAQEATVSIDRADSGLHLVVHDNGRGFDPSITARRGLAGAADRVEGLGGRLDVRTAPGAGTTVDVLLPGTTS